MLYLYSDIYFPIYPQRPTNKSLPDNLPTKDWQDCKGFFIGILTSNWIVCICQFLLMVTTSVKKSNCHSANFLQTFTIVTTISYYHAKM